MFPAGILFLDLLDWNLNVSPVETTAKLLVLLILPKKVQKLISK